jgi:sugar transferase (PEP-CTERM/EpsH1 system associated)
MKILFVVPYVPNLIRIRPYNLIRYLSGAGHEVHVATLWQNAAELEDVRRLEQICTRVAALPLTRVRSYANSAAALLTTDPLQSAYCWTPELAALIRGWLQTDHFDAVHVEHLRGARYGLAAMDFLSGIPNRPRVVWDSVDCISYLFEQASRSSRSLKGKIIPLLDLRRTRLYEGRLVASFDHILVTSAVDRAALLTLHQTARQRNPRLPEAGPITVIPNGVDTSYFTPGLEKRSPERLVFSGKMSYHANITAVLHLVNEIMPLIWARRPDVILSVVGKDPAPQILDLARQHPGRIEVTGTVPDIRPYLRAASVAVVPILYGAGVQNKVLEAMACATPVVASPIATAALQTEEGVHVLTAADAGTFAQKVLSLIDSDLQRSDIGKAGYDYVISHHRWETLCARVAQVYSSPAGRSGYDWG